MCWRMPSAVIAFAAPSAAALAAESVLAHAEATTMAAAPSKAANRGLRVIVFTGFTNEGDTSRLGDLLPRTAHRIGENELSASELGKHTRMVAPARVIPGKSRMLSPIRSRTLWHQLELEGHDHDLSNRPITDQCR